MMRSLIKLLWGGLLIALNVALGGCALLSTGMSKPVVTYDLSIPKARYPGRQASSIQLIIANPAAIRAIATDRILVKPSDSAIAYYEAVQWSDVLPRLVQIRLVQAFENTRAFRAIGVRGERLAGDLGLTVEIRAFQIEVNRGHAVAHVRLFVRVIDDNRGRVAASRLFVRKFPASNDTPGAGVQALNAAFQDVASRIVRWTVKTTRRLKHPAG